MPKQSKEKIAEETQNVLAALQQNAKENLTTLAQQCHMSKQKLLRIIRHLEKTREIWGYTAIVDKQDVPYKKFVLLLKRTMKPFNDMKVDELVEKKFTQWFEPLGVRIESTYYVHGDYDWVLIFTAPSLLQAKKFSKILFDHYPGVAERVSIMEILFTGRAHYVLNPDQSKLREIL
jgi:DNA-binding Lrp family transcriptional regulator